MRITYRQLQKLLSCLSEEQLDCDVTIEDTQGIGEPECYGNVQFRIVGSEHPCLDEDHPVLYIGNECTETRADSEDIVGMQLELLNQKP